MPAMVSRGRGRRTINEINMVPFIDVMLVLLIIFMVTAPLIPPSKIDVPSVGQGSNLPDQVIELLLDKAGTLEMKVRNQTTSLAVKDVANAVKQAQSGVTNSAVVISADRNIKYESVVQLMDTLQRAGVQRVGLSVQLVP